MADLPYRTAADRAETAAFFRGRPDAWRLFQRLAQTVAGWGAVQVVASHGRVAFQADGRFAWVSRAWTDGALTVRWRLPHRLGSPRLGTDQVGDRWSHAVRVEDLDAELLAWLREAYEWDARPADAVVRLRFRRPPAEAAPPTAP